MSRSQQKARLREEARKHGSFSNLIRKLTYDLTLLQEMRNEHRQRVRLKGILKKKRTVHSKKKNVHWKTPLTRVRRFNS